ncbi:MAG: hypothetical protein E7260_10515 [Lachnospiraceae bacterium]|nr:hypothetical protein [Lachnospiraceae bacterium]
MKKARGAWIGLLFLVVGVLYACSALDIIHFTIFFPGFWTLFLIVPCFYGLFKKGEDKTGYVLGLVIGLCFLINAQNFSFHIDFGPMLLALLCLLIGIKLIFPSKKKGKHVHVEFHTGSDRKHGFEGSEQQYGTENRAETYREAETNANKSSGYVNVSAVLGGREIRMDNEVFTGADITAVLGGAELNLRNAIINEDVFINVTTVMGGAEIYLPANVKVVTDNCTAVLGGVDVSRAYANIPAMDAPKVIISGSCVMGGVDIH